MTHYAKYETYPDGRWGYTIMHPIACRPNLLDCKYAQAVDRTGPVMLGQDGCYTVTLDETDGALVFLDKLDSLPKTELELLREIVEISGSEGNWDFSPYMLGMHNGLEFALALLEGRDPVYRNKPNRWYRGSKGKPSVLTDLELSC